MLYIFTDFLGAGTLGEFEYNLRNKPGMSLSGNRFVNATGTNNYY